jgi:hypothetical protein
MHGLVSKLLSHIAYLRTRVRESAQTCSLLRSRSARQPSIITASEVESHLETEIAEEDLTKQM